MDAQTMTRPGPTDRNNFPQQAEEFVGSSGQWTTFTGRLIPEHPTLDLGDTAFSYFNGASGIRVAIEFQMVQSQIQIKCFSNAPDLGTLRNYAADHAQCIIDCFSFLNGMWFWVDLRTATLPDGTFVCFDSSYLALASTSSGLSITFQELTSLLIEEALIIALADFRNAMRSALDSGVYCYGAIEAIMQSFKGRGDDDKKAWIKMNSALQLDQSFLTEQIKQFADTRRHRKGQFSITGTDRDECLLNTRAVIIRYCDYLRGGRTPLDVATFPLLKK